VAIQKCPFARITPGRSPLSTSWTRCGWNGRRSRYTKLAIPYSSDSGLWLAKP
jgi:hypothetical protein